MECYQEVIGWIGIWQWRGKSLTHIPHKNPRWEFDNFDRACTAVHRTCWVWSNQHGHYWIISWWFGIWIYFSIYRGESSQLTFVFFRWVGIPPTIWYCCCYLVSCPVDSRWSKWSRILFPWESYDVRMKCLFYFQINSHYTSHASNCSSFFFLVLSGYWTVCSWTLP